MKKIFAVLAVLILLAVTSCSGGGGGSSDSESGTKGKMLFATPIMVEGDNPYDFLILDVDNDGNKDLVIPSATSSSGLLRIYFGDIEGKFTRYLGIDIGTWSPLISAADITGDGVPELILFKNAECSADVYQFQNDNNLSLINSFDNGSCGNGAIIPVHINDDSYIDTFSDYGQVNLGNADGTFSTPYTIQGATGRSHVTSDFNNDGIADVASFDGAGTLSVALGNGDGSFSKATTTTAPNDGSFSSNASIAVGDINGDGITDIVANNGSLIFSFIGKGDGTFQDGIIAINNNGNIVTAIAVGDFDLDGILDLAVAESNHETAVRIYRGKGNGTFTNPYGVNTGASDAMRIKSSDMNNDGKMDLVVSHGFHNSLAIIINKSSQ